jgi:CRISPR-associated protein Cmr6
MSEKFENIGLFYQKHYFKGITFDQNGNYKKDEASKIKDRNNTLFKSNTISVEYFYSSSNIPPFKLRSIYPGIVTGIGMKHETSIEGELKLGLYFDYSSGMPCIPGASMKGALRGAFPQFENHKRTDEKIKITKGYILNDILSKINPIYFPVISKELSECKKSDFKKITELEEEIFDGKNFDNTYTDENGIKRPFISVYKKDIFHDAFIVSADGKMRILTSDAITNHPDPLKNPNPVLFLKMASGIKVQFNFDIKDGSFLTAIEKKKLFEEIILYYGIGAKTNVGYGQFEM